MEELKHKARAALERKRDLKSTLLLVVVWLAIVNGFALLASNRYNLLPDTSFVWMDPLKFAPHQTSDLIDLHVRWDGPWLVDLAQNGYHLKPDDAESNLNFFPLYPLAVRVIAPLFRGNYALAGCIASVAFLVGALLTFRTLLRERHPDVDADRTLYYLLIFPASFALNSVYTESLYLLVSMLAFLYLGRGGYLFAGLFGMLAALTRPVGFLLCVPMIVELFRRHRFQIFRRRELLTVALPPLGTAIFFFHHYLKFGDFLMYLKVQKEFGRTLLQINAENFVLLTRPSVANFVADVLFMSFALACLYLVWKRKWYSYASYIASTLLLVVLTGTLVGIARYMLVLFPIFIALASIKSQLFDRIYTLASVILLSFGITLFVNWYWGM